MVKIYSNTNNFNMEFLKNTITKLSSVVTK